MEEGCREGERGRGREGERDTHIETQGGSGERKKTGLVGGRCTVRREDRYKMELNQLES